MSYVVCPNLVILSGFAPQMFFSALYTFHYFFDCCADTYCALKIMETLHINQFYYTDSKFRLYIRERFSST